MTKDYEVIEYPTIWAADIATKKSRSSETLTQYGSTIGMWLNFLEANGYSALAWQAIDKEVVNHFIDYLIQGRDELGRPSDKTIEGYCARIAGFYRSATKAGLKHYWDMDNEEFTMIIKDKSKTTKNATVTGTKKEVKLQHGEPTNLRRDIDSFVRDDDLSKAMGLFDDYVYVVMAYVMRITALRPKELRQLPFMGSGLNRGLQDYDIEEVERTDKDGNSIICEVLTKNDEITGEKVIVDKDITFEFESKGKRRQIPFPLHVWIFICKHWIPERNERAVLFRKKNNGRSVGNGCLFLSKIGIPVTYQMMYEHFAKVSKLPAFGGKRFCPKMLRHAWATYFVYHALSKEGHLNSEYVYNSTHDDYMRKFMGHSDIATTYKYYVHIVHLYTRMDVMERIIDEESRKFDKRVAELALKNRGCKSDCDTQRLFNAVADEPVSISV